MTELTPSQSESLQAKAPSFLDEATRIIDESQEKTPQDKVILAEGFLQDIDDLAAKGEIIGSDGTVYTTKEINDRLIELVEQFDNPSVEKLDNPLLLITSSAGLRSAIDSLLLNSETASPFLQAIKDRRTNTFKGVEEVVAPAPADLFSDETESTASNESRGPARVHEPIVSDRWVRPNETPDEERLRRDYETKMATVGALRREGNSESADRLEGLAKETYAEYELKRKTF